MTQDTIKRISFELTTNHELTQTDIEDLMVAALEGGINYWCNKVAIFDDSDGDCLTDNDLLSIAFAKGCSLVLFDADTQERYELTMDKFVHGVQCVMATYDYYSVEELMDNHDADIADQIIRYALFNEIKFC